MSEFQQRLKAYRAKERKDKADLEARIIRYKTLLTDLYGDLRQILQPGDGEDSCAIQELEKDVTVSVGNHTQKATLPNLLVSADRLRVIIAPPESMSDTLLVRVEGNNPKHHFYLVREDTDLNWGVHKHGNEKRWFEPLLFDDLMAAAMFD